MFPFSISLKSLIPSIRLLPMPTPITHTHKHTTQRQGLLQDVTDGSNTQAAFKSQEVTEEVLMRVLSVYPVRPSRQPMNNRHCGSILWILNQWLCERALANTYGSPGWAVGSGGVENTKASPSVSLGWKSHLYWCCSLLCRSVFLAGDDKQAVCAERLLWRCSFSPRSCISMDPSLGHRGMIVRYTYICGFLLSVAVGGFTLTRSLFSV